MTTDDKTIFDGGVTIPDATVSEGGGTASDATVYDGGTPGGASADPFRKGGLLLDTYRIDSDPIHGGMGSVWRVRHLGWNVDLAMKRPQAEAFRSEDQKEGFIRECESWINLGLHPNIVSCYYVRQIEGVPAIFSEWMENGSLENRIRDGSVYDGTSEEIQKRLLDISIQFARGLHYAHGAGLIHQDVKPDNLLLTRDWEARVADFGLARARAQLTVLENPGQDAGDPGATCMAPTGGYTPAYCSMEQMDGKALTRRTDIYSWAVSVMELYLGDRPWTNGVVAGLSCRDYLAQTKVPLPEALKALLARCMAPNPEERPHDFAGIEAELCIIYRMQTGRAYPRPAPRAAADTADSLNNRALSFLDLGRKEEAEELWKQALEIDAYHLLSTYNRGLVRWRKGSCHNEDILSTLERCGDNRSQKEEAEALCGLIRLEAGAADLEDCCVWEGEYDGHWKRTDENEEDQPYRLHASQLRLSEAGRGKNGFEQYWRDFLFTDKQTGVKRQFRAKVSFSDQYTTPYIDKAGLICLRDKRFAFPQPGPSAPFQISRVQSTGNALEWENTLQTIRETIAAAMARRDVAAALANLDRLKDLCGRERPELFEAEEREIIRFCRVVSLNGTHEVKETPVPPEPFPASFTVPDCVKIPAPVRKKLYKYPGIEKTALSIDGTRLYICGGDYFLLVLDTASGKTLYEQKRDRVHYQAKIERLLPYIDHGKPYLFTDQFKMDDTFQVTEKMVCNKMPKRTDFPNWRRYLDRNAMSAMRFSRDGRYWTGYISRYHDFTYEFPGWVDWDEAALPYLQGFLRRHPQWNEEDLAALIEQLQYSDLGYIRPEGIRAKLNELQAAMKRKKRKKGLFW